LERDRILYLPMLMVGQRDTGATLYVTSPSERYRLVRYTFKENK